MMGFIRAVLFLLALFSAAPGAGALTIGPPEDPRTRALCDRFFAPCCWRESLAVHASPDAEKMREEIAGLLKAGYTDQQVVDRYVAQYGERILRMPRGQKAVWLTVTPLLVLAAGGIALAGYVRHTRRQATPAPAGGPTIDIPDSDLDD